MTDTWAQQYLAAKDDFLIGLCTEHETKLRLNALGYDDTEVENHISAFNELAA